MLTYKYSVYKRDEDKYNTDFEPDFFSLPNSEAEA